MVLLLWQDMMLSLLLETLKSIDNPTSFFFKNFLMSVLGVGVSIYLCIIPTAHMWRSEKSLVQLVFFFHDVDGYPGLN